MRASKKAYVLQYHNIHHTTATNNGPHATAGLGIPSIDRRIRHTRILRGKNTGHYLPLVNTRGGEITSQTAFRRTRAARVRSEEGWDGGRHSHKTRLHDTHDT